MGDIQILKAATVMAIFAFSNSLSNSAVTHFIIIILVLTIFTSKNLADLFSNLDKEITKSFF